MMDDVHVRIGTDVFNMLCGDKLGEGIHRQVFECKLRTDLVVKVETNTTYRDFANVREMKFWTDNFHASKISKWLAPCEFLSPDGYVLLQKRTHVLRQNELPAKLPAFLTDIKPGNFGLYDGRVVCHDYAMVIDQISLTLKKAEW